MEITFNYIRNRIREHSKLELLQACYNILDKKEKEPKPIWFVFLLMKWTYLYGEEKYPLKELNNQRLTRILNSITNFNQDHITNFMKNGGISRAFHILYSQQFYLQTTVYLEKFATQLKIYQKLQSKYDINESFLKRTGLNILEFLQLLQLSWLYLNIDDLNDPNLKFRGYFGKEFLNIAYEVYDRKKVLNFLRLLVLDPINPNEKINQFKRNLKSEELQSLERTFFTLYPLQVFNGNFKLIHKSIFNYCVNYYIYDYLKSNDEKFTTEFGLRFEKYIELGIRELGNPYANETELKKILPENSNVVDFYINNSNILMECKAIELQAYTSVNPTDELIFNSLKDSILKAYFKQLLKVSKLFGEGEYWGIILTYKQLYWSQFSDLYDVGKDKFPELDNSHLPPENVFIIDVFTWDRIVNIIKDEGTSLLEILKKAKKNNSKPETKKQSFHMHLDIFKNNPLRLEYLRQEKEQLHLGK